MTNREWLATLSEENLANWIYAEQTRVFDPVSLQEKVIAPDYSPSLYEVVLGWSSAYYRLVAWLKEERGEQK